MTKAQVRGCAHGARIGRCWIVVAALCCLPLALPSGAHADTESCLAAHEQAQRLRQRSAYVEARQQLLLCAQSHCPGPVSGDCIRWLSEVEASLPSVVLAVVDERGQDLVDVRVTHDGQLLVERLDGRAISLNPAVYTLRFQAAGHAPAERVVTVRAGQKERMIRVQLEHSSGDDARADTSVPSDARRYRISYGLAAGALSVLGAGVGLGVAGKRELERLEDACGDEGCSDAERAPGRRKYIAADVAFGLSAGLATAAVWLGVKTRRSADARVASASRPQLAPWVSLRGGGLQLRARF